MPLLPGANNIGKNIKTELSVGRPRKQSIAIALNTARNSGADIPMPHENSGKAYGKLAKSIEPGRARGEAVSTAARAAQAARTAQPSAGSAAAGTPTSVAAKLIRPAVAGVEAGAARGIAASTAARRLPIINAPLFDDKTKESGFEGKDQWREPLSGPSDRTVGNPPGEMSNLKGFEQNQSGTPDLSPGFPAPIQDSDFPEKGDFSPGTAKNLKDWI